MEDALTDGRGPLMEARGLVKRFGQVEALRGVDFAVERGEVVALIGDNGAGKSTLAKILSGTIQPDGGELRFDGRPVTLPTPMAARRLGIETVYQDLALAEDLTPASNLFLGREILRSGLLGKLGVLDQRAMRRATAEAFERLSVRVDPAVPGVGRLSGGQRQGVAVARSVMWASKLVFMDEPTAALGVVQSEHVLQLVRRVAGSGVAVVLISHNMPDVLRVADRVEVLRLGRTVARFRREDASMEALVGAMTGLDAIVDDPSALR